MKYLFLNLLFSALALAQSPYVCTVVSGNLPAGWILNNGASGCLITGSSTATGDSVFTLRICAGASVECNERLFSNKVVAQQSIFIITPSNLGTFNLNQPVAISINVNIVTAANEPPNPPTQAKNCKDEYVLWLLTHSTEEIKNAPLNADGAIIEALDKVNQCKQGVL